MSTIAPTRALTDWLDKIQITRRRHRRTWVGDGKAHIEVRAVNRPGSEELARDVESALEEVHGVFWAEVNAVAGRVAVAFHPESVEVDQLVGVIEDVEVAHDVDGEPFPRDRPDHPADIETQRRHAMALGANVVGLGVSGFERVLRATPLPAEVATLFGLVEQERHLRGFIENHLGAAITDLGYALTSAFVLALSEGPLGLTAAAAQRAALFEEARSRRSVWERREHELAAGRHDPPLLPLDDKGRPVPIPLGPVEHYADLAELVSLGAFGTGLAVTRSPRRAAAALAVGIPKPATFGRDAFAAVLAHRLASLDVLVMDTAALRRLDRVDTVVLDRAITSTDPAHEAALVAAARQAGHHVIATGTRIGAPIDEVERTVTGGRRLAAAVRALQRDGHVVLLVSGGDAHQALQAADCGVGVTGHAPRPPWGAHVLTPPTLDSALVMVEATTVARRVSERGSLLAGAGAGLAGFTALTGPVSTAARRAARPVYASTLLAQASATASALSLGRRTAPAPPPTAEWHAMPADEVLAEVGSSEAGLEPDEAAHRLPRQATSEPPAPVRFGRAVLGELANPLTPILGIGAGVAAAVGSASDALLVGGVMAANALVSGAERFRTEVSIERLFQVTTERVLARRAGATVEVEPDLLVRGDVLELESGDVVPADCRILEADGTEVDESVLTGESLPVAKHAAPTPGAAVADRRSMLYEGTTVVTGSALAVVVATGDDTESGRALADAPPPPPSGVERRLADLTRVTVPATLAAGAATVGLGLLRGHPVRQVIGSGVSLTVAAVPEGLPLLATAAQLAAAHRLAGRNALARNPRTIEALGRVDLLCFDKTGTLTAGRIGLQRVSDGAHDESTGRFGARTKAVLAAALRASPPTENGDDELPHATDRAIIEGAEEAGVSSGDGVGGWSQLGELAFEPARGFHAAVGTGSNGSRVAVKGAPEVVLPRCGSWSSPDGTVPVTRRVRRQLDAEVERLAGKGLRVLAVAERDASSQPELADERVSNMKLLGFVGLADHVRPTAAAAVDKLRRAGVDVVMITGDHPSTAEAIASELAILDSRGVLTGTELDQLSDSELEARLPSVSVFARVTPAHKVRIVESYQRAGRVVAMTGDGANDAPAIRLANAGIALGRRGSPAARGAADLVVTDDRIETIIDAIVEGRAMWSSVRDALAILLGGNLGEVAFTVASTAVSGTSALNARQLLLVNLLTDMLPALAIALRPPAGRAPEALLHEGPEASLGAPLVREILVRACATAAGAGGAWLVARGTGRAKRASTVALVALVGTQLAQTAVIGGTSPVVLAAALGSGAVLVGIVQTPVVSQFFGCTPLGPIGWGIGGAASALATGAAVAGPHLVRLLRPERDATDQAHLAAPV